MTKRLKMYIVHLGATLPCTATMTVKAESESEALKYAEEHPMEADWNGADYDRPAGCDVEVCSVTEI